MTGIYIVVGIVCLALGAGIAYFVVSNSSNSKVKEADRRIEDARKEAERIASEAQRDAETTKKTALVETREEILQLRQKSDAEEKKRKNEISAMEQRVLQREELLDKRSDTLDRKEHQLSSLQGQLDSRKREVDSLYQKQTAELERVAALTKEDAKQELLDRVRQDTVREEAQILRDSEQRRARSFLRPFSAARRIRPARSPSRPSTSPLTTSRAVSSAERVAISVPSNRFPGSPLSSTTPRRRSCCRASIPCAARPRA